MATFFGGTTTNAFGASGNYIYFFLAVCTADGTVTDGQVYYNSGSSNVKLAVYANSAGAPTAKLGESGVIALGGGAGWKATTYAAPFPVTSGTSYWLAWLTDGSPQLGGVVSGAQPYRFLSSTYPTYPASGAGSTSSANVVSGLQAGVTGGFVPQFAALI